MTLSFLRKKLFINYLKTQFSVRHDLNLAARCLLIHNLKGISFSTILCVKTLLHKLFSHRQGKKDDEVIFSRHSDKEISKYKS